MFTAIRFWLFAVGLPLLSLVLVRVLIRPEGQYEGTELVISADGAKSGLLGVLSTIPAAAWPLSARVTPFNLREQPLASAFLFAALVGAGVALATQRWSGRKATPARAAAPPSSDPWLPAVMVVFFWLSCVATVTFASKYANEVRELGHTYHYYAPALLCLGVLVYGLATWARQSSWRWRFVLAAGAVAPVLITAQLAVNWSLLEVQKRDLSSLSRLIELETHGTSSVEERCAAAERFKNAKIPGYGYPADLMVSDIDTLYSRRTGEGFC